MASISPLLTSAYDARASSEARFAPDRTFGQSTEPQDALQVCEPHLARLAQRITNDDRDGGRTTPINCQKLERFRER